MKTLAVTSTVPKMTTDPLRRLRGQPMHKRVREAVESEDPAEVRRLVPYLAAMCATIAIAIVSAGSLTNVLVKKYVMGESEAYQQVQEQTERYENAMSVQYEAEGIKLF